MPSVTHEYDLPDGTAPSEVSVVIRIVGSTTGEAPGYVTASDKAIAGRHSPTVTAGAWSVTLIANSLISPANTVYEITTSISGAPVFVEYITVPDGAGPYTVADILTTAPTALSPAVGHGSLTGLTTSGHPDTIIAGDYSAFRAVNDSSDDAHEAFTDIDTLLSGPGIAGMYGDRLRAFRAAWADRASNPVDVVVVGDSMVQGYLATGGADNRWTDLLARRLERANGQRPALGYVPCSTASLAGYTGRLWTVAVGTPTYNAFGGLGYASSTLLDSDTGALTYTTVCDRVFVYYPTFTSLAASLAISIDGSVVTTINQTTGTTAGGRRYDTGVLARGVHEVKLQKAGVPSYNARVEGAYFCDGNGTVGVRVWNGGHFGYATTQFAATGATSWWTAGFDTQNPDLVVVALGANDQSGSVTAAQLKTNLAAIVTQVNASVADTTKPPSFLFVAPSGTGASSSLTTTYRNAIWQAAHDSGAAVLDLNAVFGYIGAGTGGDPYGLTGDNLHPNNKGHALTANVIADFLLRAVGEPEPYTSTDQRLLMEALT